MRVARGDVVLVSYPFASRGGAKIRPALVIQCDRNNGRLDNTVIAQITSRIRYARTEPTQVLVTAASPAGQQAGLLNDSAISCENLYTVRQDTVIRKIGSMPTTVMDHVNDALKVSLEIS
jgi:mRNA interferase MazF